MRLVILLFLAACVASCSAAGCKSLSDPNELQVPAVTFKSHENYVLFGKLDACPRAGQELSDALRFVVIPKSGVNVVLLNERLGDFMYTPATDFVGIATFWYHVEDEQGSSEPSTVTISVQPIAVQPSLNVTQHIIGLEDDDIELDIIVENKGSRHQWEDMSLAICNCAHDVTCNRESEDCHCHLSLPDGWEIYSGTRQLTLAELKSLSLTEANNLILRAAPSSAAEHCLAVHILNPANEDDPSIAKKQMDIHIHPIHSTVILNPPQEPSPHPQPIAQEAPRPAPKSLNTTQGRPYMFHDLRVLDLDGVEGTYLVTIELDRGGLLWIRQDVREDVVFLPRTVEIHPEEVPADKVYQLLHRFETFKTTNRPFELEENNNGVKLLRFIGSLEGVNEVLSTLTFVPWCSEWPTPPSWPLPERSWMGVPSDPSADPHHPTIWPQWYPRFWYPFMSHHWTWWPRVIPPWWLTTVCSNWMSSVSMVVQEIPAVTCEQDTEQTTAAHWSADITVITSGHYPKSLVTYNHFSYFQPDTRSVHIESASMRSRHYDLGANYRLNLTVLESNWATADFPSTGLNYADCRTVEECNNHLMNIRVNFKEGVQDVCHITIQVDMHEHGSTQLGDRLVVWAVNTTRECVDVTATHADFELTPKNPVVRVRQGSVDNPLHLLSNIQAETPVRHGILHVKVFAEHGHVTMKVPDGIRIYSDHMGQHEGIPTYLCIAGPIAMVLEALATARLTPFEPLYGETVVTVDYRVPSTATKLLYGEALPFRRLQITVDVNGRVQPYMPVVYHPTEVCVSQPAGLPINMTTIIRRFNEDEQVTFDIIDPRLGSLQLNTGDKALFECPIQHAHASGGICAEMCSGHLDCPDATHLCCSNGCGHSCMPGTLKANLQITQSGQVIMHGLTHDINQNLLRKAIQYIPAPCTGGGTDTYTDTIIIRITPSRNHEGDSVRVVMPVHVTCTGSAQQVVMGVEEPMSDCQWGEWSTCQTGEHTCGIGNRQRSQTCNSQEVVEDVPCLNCTCSPVHATITDPSSNMQGCSSVAAVLRCPQGCSVSSFHLETTQFRCQPSPGMTDAKTLMNKETNIRIHDACFCEACVSSRQDK